MQELPLNIPQYPMLRWITRWGGSLTTLASAVVAFLAILGGVQSGQPSFVLIGIAAGALFFVVLRALVEMVRLITDMLLPK